MAISNPYVKGSSAYQNFESTVAHSLSLSDSQLQSDYNEMKAKSDNFLNYNTFQMDMFEQKCRALKAVMDSRK